jgi:hypothetical protein
MARRGTFYEDDEPVERLEAAYERGAKVVSETQSKVSRGWNSVITLKGVKPTSPKTIGKTRAALAG